MATIVNARDVLLQGSTRLVDVVLPSNIVPDAVREITLSPSTGVFKTDASGGTTTPTSITLTLTRKYVTGTATFTVIEGTATLTGSGDTRTLTFANMSSERVVIRATVVFNSVTYTATYGTLETDWHRGGLWRVDKDFDSVTVLGDDIDEDHTVQVYWQDDDSVDWEYLGEVTESGQELRWSDYTTRPNTKALKLGLALNAKSTLLYTGTPVIRAVTVKYHNMITDWWRYNMEIAVHDDQIMLDGVANTFTTAQMVAHLDALSKQVAPVIFSEDGGTTYREVKVLDAVRRLDKSEFVSGALVNSYIYNVAIEQVTQGTYTP